MPMNRHAPAKSQIVMRAAVSRRAPVSQPSAATMAAMLHAMAAIAGKWKASQNRPAADRAGVIDGLAARQNPMAGVIPRA